jgi:hypothetical protein
VGSAKQVLINEEAAYHQIFVIEEDGSIVPVDYNDYNGQWIIFKVDGEEIGFEYDSVICGKEKTIHCFQNKDKELLIHDEKTTTTVEIRDIHDSICNKC